MLVPPETHLTFFLEKQHIWGTEGNQPTNEVDWSITQKTVAALKLIWKVVFMCSIAIQRFQRDRNSTFRKVWKQLTPKIYYSAKKWTLVNVHWILNLKCTDVMKTTNLWDFGKISSLFEDFITGILVCQNSNLKWFAFSSQMIAFNLKIFTISNLSPFRPNSMIKP